MKILVIGKNGQLGRSIQKISSESLNDNIFVFVGRDLLDLSSKDGISSYFLNKNFDIVINCAAYTDVDKAEIDIENSDQVNHLAVKQLSEIALKQKFKLIHISTDYVFDGLDQKLYKENDKTNPINVYGRTKFLGEQSIIELMPKNAIIIRTSWLYSEFGNNFVNTMLKLGKERDEINIVNDQIGSPTYAGDLAEVILKILNNKSFIKKNEKTEIYHFSNNSYLSWFDYAKEIFKIAQIECQVNPISSSQFPSKAKRPINSVMCNDKIIQKYNIKTLEWKFSLENCITNILLK